MRDLGDTRITRGTARRGLAIYFAVLVPLTAVVSGVAIAKGSVNWVIPGMAVPALASVIARLVLHEGFADIGWRLRDRKVLRYAGVGLVLPIAVGSLAYGTAWAAGLATFDPESWNAVIGGAFDEATQGHNAQLWIGESGILVTVLLIVLAIALTRAHTAKRPTLRRTRQTGLAPA